MWFTLLLKLAYQVQSSVMKESWFTALSITAFGRQLPVIFISHPRVSDSNKPNTTHTQVSSGNRACQILLLKPASLAQEVWSSEKSLRGYWVLWSVPFRSLLSPLRENNVSPGAGVSNQSESFSLGLPVAKDTDTGICTHTHRQTHKCLYAHAGTLTHKCTSLGIQMQL